MFYIEGEGIDEADVTAAVERILSYLGEDGDFSIHFVSDEEIRALNRSYRDKDEATDILTIYSSRLSPCIATQRRSPSATMRSFTGC